MNKCIFDRILSTNLISRDVTRMISYSIFIRDLAEAERDAPRLLAFDIPDRSDAQLLASGIAASYPDHGFNPDTHVHWFRSDDRVHEIYTWPHQ